MFVEQLLLCQCQLNVSSRCVECCVADGFDNGLGCVVKQLLLQFWLFTNGKQLDVPFCSVLLEYADTQVLV